MSYRPWNSSLWCRSITFVFTNRENKSYNSGKWSRNSNPDLRPKAHTWAHTEAQRDGKPDGWRGQRWNLTSVLCTDPQERVFCYQKHPGRVLPWKVPWLSPRRNCLSLWGPVEEVLQDTLGTYDLSHHVLSYAYSHVLKKGKWGLRSYCLYYRLFKKNYYCI